MEPAGPGHASVRVPAVWSSARSSPLSVMPAHAGLRRRACGATRGCRWGSPTGRWATSRPRSGSTARRRCTTACCTCGWRCSAARRRRPTRCRWCSRCSRSRRRGGRRGRCSARARPGSRALLVATNPFLTQYAQETRMYALLILLGVLACGCFARAFVFTGTDEDPGAPPAGAGRSRFAVVLAAMLYTHNWALFFARRLRGRVARPARRRAAGRTAGAAGRRADRLRRRAGCSTSRGCRRSSSRSSTPARRGRTRRRSTSCSTCRSGCWAMRGQYMLLLGGRRGRGRARSPRRTGGSSARGRAAAGDPVRRRWSPLLAAWTSSQVSPAWAGRYLAIGVPAAAARVRRRARPRRAGSGWSPRCSSRCSGRATRRRSASPTCARSRRRSRRACGPATSWSRPSPRRSRCCTTTCRRGCDYATLWGPVSDVGVTDWRDGVERLRAHQRGARPRAAAGPSSRAAAGWC